ncbi:hypothetical protein F4859DRAFT_109090 [Xylaria cf. heliscus]|nr:hypothetical protein F4859DRAFT_109090 [Xylaria cf. heliscus]
MICQIRGAQCQFDFIPTMTPQEWRDRIVTLLRDVIWGFRQNPGVEAQTHARPAITDDFFYTAIITINTPRLEILLNPELTLGERCTAQVGLATTIMHELMHALTTARHRDDRLYVGNRLNARRSGRNPAEPFLDGQGVAEAGHYMDQLFFGGTTLLYPYIRDNPLPPIRMVIREFPWLGCSEGKNPAPSCRAMDIGAPVTVHHVPSTWASKMLSESFWRDPAYPRKSDNFFHRNEIFVSVTPNNAHVPADVEVRRPPAQQNNYPEDALVMDTWDQRHRFWDRFRQGWYDDEKEKWDMSPWRSVLARRSVEDFALGFAKKDLLLCTNIAQRMIRSIKWTVDMPTYVQDLPLAGQRLPYWAWHVIGLLMMASIPRIQKSIVRKQNRGTLHLHLTPSIAAANAGYDMPVFILINSTADAQGQANPLKFYDQLGRIGLIEDYTQRDCLILIDNIITYIMLKQGIVHKNLLDAIMEAKDVLFADRKKIEKSYPNVVSHTSKWASRWVFKFPPYDQTCYQYGPGGKESLVS